MPLKNLFSTLAVSLSLNLIAAQAWAITSTETLPRGVRAFSFIYGQASGVDSNLNSSGAQESLIRPLNRTITLDDLAKTEPRLKKLQNALNALSPDSLGNQLLLANLYSSVSVQEARQVGAFFWGLSDDVAIGMIVPRISRQYTVGFDARVSNYAGQLRQILGNVPQVDEGLREVERADLGNAKFQEAIFSSNGYLPLRGLSVSGLGDVEAEFRHRYFRSQSVDLAARYSVRLPTATHRPDLRNLLDRELGTGSFGLKAGTLHTVKLIPERLAFQSAVFGTWNSPSRPRLAVPKNPDDDLADLNDPWQIEDVRRQYGPQLDLDAGLEFTFGQGLFTVAGSYQHSIKGADQYTGERGLDYERLARNTEAVSRSAELALEFSAVSLYRKGLIPIPGKLAVTWHQLLSGINVPLANYGRLDAVLFF